MANRVIITGASGMVGSLILKECLNDNRISEIISLVRRKSNQTHSKLKEIMVSDFLNLGEHEYLFKDVDIAYFCLGAYTGSVSDDLLESITVGMPLHFAQILNEFSPNASFCLLSGQGADRSEKTKIKFAKYKGKIENLISAMTFKFHTFRPGYIYPVEGRKEPNIAYRIMRVMYPMIKLLGKNYSIPSTELAQVIFNVGLDNMNQQEIFENKDIKDLASQLNQ